MRNNSRKLFVAPYLAMTAVLIVIVSSPQASADEKPILSPKCNQFIFDATDSYDPDKENLNFRWDFGDGQTSSEPVVTHTYAKPGTFEVNLTITDNSGLECSTQSKSQIVEATVAPIATIEAPEQSCTNFPITFDGSQSHFAGKSIEFSWEFGDGTPPEKTGKVTKIFKTGGTYKVVLTVGDDSKSACSTQSVEKTIKINEAPNADAGKDVLLKCVLDETDLEVEFNASNTTDASNDQLSYSWDFGDGEQAQGKSVKHTYTQLGNYDAQLIVKDNSREGCSTGVDFVTVRLNKAPEAVAGDDVLSCVGKEIVFDGSKSISETKGTLLAKWNFGDDATDEGMKVTHRYLKAGVYQAALTVENELNPLCPQSTDTRQVIINASPTVSIKSEDSVCLGAKIDFDASGASDPDADTLEYYWSFGDGTIERAGAKVTHQYTHGGNYRVTVIVDDGKGSACSTATTSKNIKVNTAPLAHAGANLACCTQQETIFDATASSDPDGDELKYIWDFGDGTQDEGKLVNHAYKKGGSYDVTLTVDDGAGSSCSKSTDGFVAKVNAAPVPIINVR